ncbi:hypothetical protein J9537_10560 [Enterococcus raffinosus]|uniref:hypothetical protein n=1 Tax=Enterococcus raffinosus TaxID=71452 RepID=UPI001C461324|nr:hypothetical protein [Enterococcus raffinosus]QXJ58460.1 hypothetical protein J9537_10560 [Enterococcus raffinosus]
MEYRIDYELTAKIEIINEFSYGIYNRLLNYILNNGIDRTSSNLYSTLLSTLGEMLSVDLFNFSKEELEKTLLYWKNMNQFINEITDKVKTQPV